MKESEMFAMDADLRRRQGLDKLVRDRDALLAVARHAHIYLVQSDDPDKRELADELWAAIKESEKP